MLGIVLYCNSFLFTLDLLIDCLRVFVQRQNAGWFAVRLLYRDKIHVIPDLLSSWQQSRDCSALPGAGVSFLAHLVSLLYTHHGLLRPAAELSPVSLVCMPDESLYCCPPPTKVDIFLCWKQPCFSELKQRRLWGTHFQFCLNILLFVEGITVTPRQYKSYYRALSSYSRIPEMRKS